MASSSVCSKTMRVGSTKEGRGAEPPRTCVRQAVAEAPAAGQLCSGDPAPAAALVPSPPRILRPVPCGLLWALPRAVALRSQTLCLAVPLRRLDPTPPRPRGSRAADPGWVLGVSRTRVSGAAAEGGAPAIPLRQTARLSSPQVPL